MQMSSKSKEFADERMSQQSKHSEKCELVALEILEELLNQEPLEDYCFTSRHPHTDTQEEVYQECISRAAVAIKEQLDSLASVITFACDIEWSPDVHDSRYKDKYANLAFVVKHLQ